jgi:hypothetical protein
MQGPGSRYLSEEDKKKAEQAEKESAKHALDRWRKTHSLPWLVAALSTNSLNEKGNRDLLEAANKIPPSSPAFLTASFYLIDPMICSNRKEEAGRRLSSLLSRNDPSNDGSTIRQANFISLPPAPHAKKITFCITWDWLTPLPTPGPPRNRQCHQSSA